MFFNFFRENFKNFVLGENFEYFFRDNFPDFSSLKNYSEFFILEKIS